MKVKYLSIVAAIAIGLWSCEPKAETAETTEVATAEKTYTLSNDASQVEWKGTMLGMYVHTGTLKFAEGSITTNGGKVTAGNFKIDWSTLATTDSNYSKEQPSENLIGHLKSKDFFAADSLGAATFKITGTEGNDVVGDLTIRGITNSEKVTDVVLTEGENGLTATGNLVFDRQKYQVSYKNTYGDAVISDDIELKISLSAK